MKVICLMLPILAFVNADGQYSKNGASNTAGLNNKAQPIIYTQKTQPSDLSASASSLSSSSSPTQQNSGQYYSAQGSSYASQSVPYPSAQQTALYPAAIQDTQYSTGQSGIYAPAIEENYPPAIEEVEGQPYANSQILENPSYDPELYQNFVPQDAVQQYVSQYGGPYPPNYGPGIPYGGPGGYPNPAGFAIQTGYEGFLVPSIPPPPPPGGPGFFEVFAQILPFPRTMSSLVMRSGSYILSALAAILMGGAVTTAICTMTPLCSITFAALPLIGLRGTVEKVGAELTTDRVKRAAEFVKTALEKYQKMQRDIKGTKVEKARELIEGDVKKVE